MATIIAQVLLTGGLCMLWTGAGHAFTSTTPTCSFDIAFPGEPKLEQASGIDADGTPYEEFRWELEETQASGQARTWAVICTVHARKPNIKHHDAAAQLGKNVRLKDITLDGMPCREMFVTIPEGEREARFRYCRAGSRMVQLAYVGGPASAAQADVESFMQSFKFRP